MNRNSIKARRAVSAKPKGPEKKLLQQPMKNRSVNRKLIRTYTQSYDEKPTPSKARSNRVHTSFMQNSQLRLIPQKAMKQSEQLMEENFHLRSEVNTLSNKLYVQRSKIEAQKKKTFQYSKKLNREFEKELYWASSKNNEYLIAGIKHQYEKMKEMYELKCQENQMITRAVSSTQIQQLSTYCEALETENKLLAENITFLKKQKAKAASLNHQDHQSSNKALTKNAEYLQGLLLEQRRRSERYKGTTVKLEEQLHDKNMNQRQLQKKITFLQKLIIQKQNNFYHANRKTKELEREKNKFSSQFKLLQEKLKQQSVKYQFDIDSIMAMNQKQTEVEKRMFDKTLKEKNHMIEKLQKEVGYLSTLLSYWKPLDNIDSYAGEMERINENDGNVSSSHDRSVTSPANSGSFVASGFGGGRDRVNSRTKSPLQLHNASSMEYDQNEQSDFRRTAARSLNADEFPTNRQRGRSITTAVLEEDNIAADDEPDREIRRSDKRWNPDSTKCRKKALHEIQHIGELIRYKMIGEKVSLEEVKLLFGRYRRSLSVKRRPSKFEEEVITMSEIKETLVSHPFNLKQEESYDLSRYIVEDQSVEYVYCDLGNEIERSIAKSIIKAVIGEYELPDYSKCEARWKEIKEKYSHNMQLALKSICPKGLISKEKFLELVQSLDIELGDETENWLLGQLIKGRDSLQELKYEVIFEKEERIE